VKNSKYDILAGVTAYVKQLQARSSDIHNDIRSIDQQLTNNNHSNKSANIIPQDHPTTIPSSMQPQHRSSRSVQPVDSSLATIPAGSSSSSSSRHPDPFKPIASSFSDRNFRLYFMQSPMALALAATDGRIFECNQAFQDITGLQKEHVLHASIFKLVDPNFLQEAYINIGLLLQPVTAAAAAMADCENSAASAIDPSTSDPNASSSDQQRSYLKVSDPHNDSSSPTSATGSSTTTTTTTTLKRPRSSMEASSSTPAATSAPATAPSATDLAIQEAMNISSTKSFYVKSLIISAYDGKHLNMAIGVLMPERNSHLRQNSFYPTSLQQSCFSVALVPGDLEQ
jgi:hypothetical protein